MAKRTLVLDEFIPYRLSVTSNLLSDAIAGAYDALFGLRIPEWRVIAVVAAHDGISQQEIGVQTRMDKLTVSRAAIALAERGLLLRKPNTTDKRSHLLILSKGGRTLYSQVVPKALELEALIFSGFRRDEVANFVSMLRRVEQVVLELAPAMSARD